MCVYLFGCILAPARKIHRTYRSANLVPDRQGQVQIYLKLRLVYFLVIFFVILFFRKGFGIFGRVQLLRSATLYGRNGDYYDHRGIPAFLLNGECNPGRQILYTGIEIFK